MCFEVVGAVVRADMSRAVSGGRATPPSRFWAVDGCGSDQRSECMAAGATAAIRCCNDAVNSCYDAVCLSSEHSDYLTPLTSAVLAQSGNAVSHGDAAAECAAHGKRLCDQTELNAGACCSSGCGHVRASSASESSVARRSPSLFVTQLLCSSSHHRTTGSCGLPRPVRRLRHQKRPFRSGCRST